MRSSSAVEILVRGGGTRGFGLGPNVLFLFLLPSEILTLIPPRSSLLLRLGLGWRDGEEGGVANSSSSSIELSASMRTTCSLVASTERGGGET